MNTERTTFLPPRTPEDPSDLIKEILEIPEVAVSYDGGACYLAAIDREGQWDVWSYCEESRSLCREGTFDTCAKALSHARDRGEEILEEFAQVQAEIEEAELEAKEVTSDALAAPYLFSDNTDFQGGIELEAADGVLAVFCRHPNPLKLEVMDNLYLGSLTDGYGAWCRVMKTHRGDLHIETER